MGDYLAMQRFLEGLSPNDFYEYLTKFLMRDEIYFSDDDRHRLDHMDDVLSWKTEKPSAASRLNLWVVAVRATGTGRANQSPPR